MTEKEEHRVRKKEMGRRHMSRKRCAQTEKVGGHN